MALPYALGVTMILSALAAGIFTYTTMNQGAAKRQAADQRAYGLAETGLSYALSTLQNSAPPRTRRCPRSSGSGTTREPDRRHALGTGARSRATSGR